MPFRLRITDVASHEIRELPGHVRQRVRRVVETLADNPTPPGAKELRGRPGRYRIPLLRWRVIYRVEHDTRTVLVLTVRRKTSPQTYEGIE